MQNLHIIWKVHFKVVSYCDGREKKMDTRTFNTVNERFGFEIEGYRNKHKLKQYALAAELHLSQSELSRIEMGKVAVDLVLFYELFGVCKTFVFLMLLRSYYPDNLEEMIKENYPASVYKVFMLWVKYLAKTENAELKMHYSRDHTRVE